MKGSFLPAVPLLLLALASSARAQPPGFDAQRLAPAAGAAGGVYIERPAVPDHLAYGFGLFVHFADDALVVRDLDSRAILSRPLDASLTVDLLASIALFEVF